MASGGEIKLVFSADVRPAKTALDDLRDRVDLQVASTAAGRTAALARMYRRQLLGVAEYMAARRKAHARFDPRRLSCARIERTCRRFAAELEVVAGREGSGGDRG